MPCWVDVSQWADATQRWGGPSSDCIPRESRVRTSIFLKASKPSLWVLSQDEEETSLHDNSRDVTQTCHLFFQREKNVIIGSGVSWHFSCHYTSKNTLFKARKKSSIYWKGQCDVFLLAANSFIWTQNAFDYKTKQYLFIFHCSNFCQNAHNFTKN